MKPKLSRWIASWAVLALSTLSLTATTEDDPAVPWRSGERVEVELRTVPFYAVDAEGRPVEDLTAAEVELRIDGKAIPFDTFDRYLAQGTEHTATTTSTAATSGPRAPAPAHAAAAESRHVFLLFDAAFLPPRQFYRAQQMVAGLLENSPATDLLFLLVNDPRRGLIEVAGPVPADVAGKATLRARVGELVPNTALSIDPTAGIDRSPATGGPVGDQTHNAIEAIRATAAGEYMATAEAFGKGLSAFAARLRSITAPKVFYLVSGGINDRFFFDGNSGLKIGSGEGEFQVSTRYRAGLATSFEEPLAALAASGAVPVYLHPPAEGGPSGREALRAMREKTGGMFFEGNDAELIATRASRATEARYEVGFYAGQLPPGVLGGKEIEIAVRRPGVRIFSADRLISQVATRDLGPAGRRYWVVELVRRGLEGRALAASAEKPPRLLPGRAAAAAFDDGRRLVFEPDWSALFDPVRFQLYDVLLRVEAGATDAELVHVNIAGPPSSPAAARLTAPLPTTGAIIWGVVAIQPQTGETWFRRFLLEAPKPAPTRAESSSKR